MGRLLNSHKFSHNIKNNHIKKLNYDIIKQEFGTDKRQNIQYVRFIYNWRKLELVYKKETDYYKIYKVTLGGV